MGIQADQTVEKYPSAVELDELQEDRKFRYKRRFKRKREIRSDCPSIWPALEANFKKFGIPVSIHEGHRFGRESR